jgi:UDP-N-acetylmuramoyl-L-alanyl-D-glutamate--2,6-diaminopimelate ligase
MLLEHLIQDLAILQLHGELQAEVGGITYHSGQVSEASLFVAVQGMQSDGHDFVRQAIDRGAHTVVVEKPLEPIPGITIIRVASTRAALAQLATRFYDFPSHKLTVIGITGTNGKTTTAYLLESILAACDQRVGVIGTVNIRYPDHVGLDMHRVDGTRFAVGLFTNLSQDHLDYHGTMENYFAAKSRLFSQILQTQGDKPALAVINGDDVWGQRLCSQVNGPLLRYGLEPNSEIHADKILCDSSGIKALVHTPRGDLKVHSSMIGRLNLYNLLAATSVAVGLDLPLEAIRSGEKSLAQVPGRLESIPNDMGFQVLVDYAHTPDALEKALESLKELQFRKIICVFGCGGDRDRGKRPLMGEVAAQRADLLVITSDNPRSEVPEAIMADIEAGIRNQGFPLLSTLAECTANCRRGYTLVVDRGQAIRMAIDAARAGDVVYIGGKGHEDYQILGNTRIDFDDRVVAAQALEQKRKRETF